MGAMVTVRYSLALFLLVSSVHSDMIDISAFEYYRRFNSTLGLGDCPTRQVAYPMGTAPEICYYQRRTGTQSVADKVVQNSRNIPVRDPQTLMTLIGLCDDKSAAYFGYLYQAKDCVATEIANKFTFSSKTAVRAYKEHFRPRMSILNPSLELNIPPDFSHYLTDVYYVHNIGIGTQEVLVMEMQFADRRMAQKADAYRVESKLMSESLRTIARDIGVPKKIKIIRLSTANHVLQMKKYKGTQIWTSALQWLDYCEKQIERTKEELQFGNKEAHLKYGLQPYEVGPRAERLSSVTPRQIRESWENVTLCEVTATRAYATYKRFRKYCKGTNKVRPICKRINTSLKELKTTQGCVHTKRADWSALDYREQQAYIARMRNTLKALELSLRISTKYLKRGLRIKARKS